MFLLESGAIGFVGGVIGAVISLLVSFVLNNLTAILSLLGQGGVDIGGQTGDPIHAFAAGTVEYVGENDSYGLYLQLDHGGGIKSFYAHCRSVCVKKGQTVALGEKIGEVGSSDSATGPHLHLELKYNGLHLDPAYYIDCLSDQ